MQTEHYKRMRRMLMLARLRYTLLKRSRTMRARYHARRRSSGGSSKPPDEPVAVDKPVKPIPPRKSVGDKVNEMVEQQVINRPIRKGRDEFLNVTWSDNGKQVTSMVRARNLESFYNKNKVITIQDRGPKGTVYFDRPTDEEYNKLYTDVLRQEYKSSGSVPSDIKKDITVPAVVSKVGLSDLFVREAYEDMLGLNPKKTRPKGFVGPIDTRSDFQKAFTKRFGTLPSHQKFDISLHYGELKDKNLKVKDYAKYEGGTEYIKLHKEEVLKKYLSEDNKVSPYAISSYLAMGKTPFTFSSGKRGTSKVKGYTPEFREWEARATLFGYGSKGEDVKTTSSGTKYRILNENRDTREYYFSKHNPITKAYSTFFHSAVQTLASPITLSQLAVKYGTGKGKATDVLGRIGSGHTMGLPDIAVKLHGVRPGGPSGLIATGVSEGVGAVSGQGSDAWARFRRDPLSGISGTAGEIFGALALGTGMQSAKATTLQGAGVIRKGLMARTNFNIPSYSSLVKYRPGYMLRTGYWRLKTKIGLVEQLPEKPTWHAGVLSGKERFNILRGVKDQGEAQYNIFQETRKMFDDDSIYTIHATPNRFKRLTKVQEGSSESPGMSLAPYGEGSPTFLGIGKVSYPSAEGSISLLPKLHFPTAPVLRLKDVFRLPKHLRRASYKESGRFILEQKPGPYSWIAPKTELSPNVPHEMEAILRAGSVLKRYNKRYWTTYKGVAVPLPRYDVLGDIPSGLMSASKGLVKDASKVFSLSYSYGSKPISIISPYYVGSTVSRVSSYKPSSYSVKSLSSSGYSSSSYSTPKSSYKSGSSTSRPSYSLTPSKYKGSSGSSSKGGSSSGSYSSSSYSLTPSSYSYGPGSSYGYPSYTIRRIIPKYYRKKKHELNKKRYEYDKKTRVRERYVFREFDIPNLDDLIRKVGKI